MNLVTLADETINTFGEYPFLIFDDRIYTNRQIIRDANRLASSLQGLGLKKGDNIVVMLPNCPEVIISYQGILRNGCVIVPLIPLMNEKELMHILDNCEAVAMITIRDIFLKNEKLLGHHQTLKHIIVLNDEAVPGALSFAQLIHQAPESFSPPAIDEKDLAVILYTAGTTSSPKGVMLTHKNLYSNAVNAARAHDTRSSDITLIALPLAAAGIWRFLSPRWVTKPALLRVALSALPVGGALVYRAGYIYALRGDGKNSFYRYNIAANTWSAMAVTPANVKAGGALTTDGTIDGQRERTMPVGGAVKAPPVRDAGGHLQGQNRGTERCQLEVSRISGGAEDITTRPWPGHLRPTPQNPRSTWKPARASAPTSVLPPVPAPTSPPTAKHWSSSSVAKNGWWAPTITWTSEGQPG